MKRYLMQYTYPLVALAVFTAMALGGWLPQDAAASAMVVLAVSSSGLTSLFAGVEDIDDMFMATMEEMDKEIQDELTVSHPIWEYLQRNNLIEYVDSIATHVHVPLRTKKNPTVKWHTAYEDADSTPAQLLDEAKFLYGHLTGRQMYNREELIKNSGPQQLIDLVESKADQLLSDINEEFADTIIGTQDADGRKPLGIGRIMDPTLAVGGINPATAGYEFWKPFKCEKSAGVNFALATEFRDGMRKLYRNIHTSGGGKVLGNKPKDGKGDALTMGQGYVLICGEDLYNEHQKYAETALRLTIADIKNQQGWGSYEMFDYNGTTIVYDKNLGAKVGWLVNFKRGVRVRIHRGTNFLWTPWGFLDNKVQVKYRDNLTYVSVYARSRRANGVITFS
jgi:hypothetical protein